MADGVFRPRATVRLAYTTATANVALPLPGALAYDAANMPERTIRLFNDGLQTAFVAFGNDGTITADLTTSMPIGAGQAEAFRVLNTRTHFAVITAAGSGNMHATVGEGG